MIMEELDRQEQQGATSQWDMIKEAHAIQKALAALEREAHRWDEAYAREVIDLGELKAKKLDITERKQRLLTQQEAVDTAMQSAQQSQAKTRDILKRQALEALDIRVTWTPGEPLHIEGSVPLVATANSTLQRGL